MLEGYSPVDLHNGLSHEENAILVRTPQIYQALTLVSRGLRGKFKNPPDLESQVGTDTRGVH